MIRKLCNFLNDVAWNCIFAVPILFLLDWILTRFADAKIHIIPQVIGCVIGAAITQGIISFLRWRKKR